MEHAIKLAELWVAALGDHETATSAVRRYYAGERMFAYNAARSQIGVSDEAWEKAKRVVAQSECVEPRY